MTREERVKELQTALRASEDKAEKKLIARQIQTLLNQRYREKADIEQPKAIATEKQYKRRVSKVNGFISKAVRAHANKEKQSI